MCAGRAFRGWGLRQWKLWLLRLGDQCPGEQASAEETGGGGVDAPLGEQGDFVGPDRDPVKEVELVGPAARVLYELVPPQGWSSPLKHPFIKTFAESLEFWGFVLLQIPWATLTLGAFLFGCRKAGVD